VAARADIGPQAGVRASAALEALLATKSTGKGRIVDASGGAAGPWIEGIAATAMKERDLVDAIRRGKPPDVVVVARASPTLVRALRESPPALLVVCDAIAQDEHATLAAIPGLLVLGGAAALRLGGGKIVACAHGREELAGIVRALGAAEVRLALAPTPAWLWRWLADAKLKACTVAGTVHARALSVEWARWAETGAAKSVLVPVGFEPPPLDRPKAPELDAAVAAHALERWTGPVFPSPRVIAIVRGGLSASADDDGDAPTAATLAVWTQARRALPLTGAIVGMERPAPELAMDAPTAAFLAQRALLRVAQCRALAEAQPPVIGAIADDGLARALEVLEGAPELLSDHESKVVLRGVGMHVTRQAIASSASGASGFAERIGFPVVLKALSPDLRRRTEIGAVALDLANAAAVRRAYGSIVENVERRAPTARLDGVVVAEMVGPGLELQAGIIELGSGDAAMYARALGEAAPLEPVLGLVSAAGSVDAPARAVALAHAVLTRLPVPALRRGSDPDVRALAELLLRLAELWLRMGARLRHVELERVRLVGGERGYVILDARIHQRAHLEGR
jgi:hypothetical protein